MGRERVILWGGYGVLLVTLVALAVERAPLIFDGSYFLFRVVETRSVYLPLNRFLGAPAQLLTTEASGLWRDPWGLGLVFSAGYLALVTGTFVVGAEVLRREAPGRQVWALLGLLVMAPVFLDTTTESLMTVALAFPLLALALGARSHGRVLALVVVAVLVLLSHPAAGVVLVVVGVAVLLLRRDARVMGWAPGVVLLALGVARLRGLATGYESEVARPGALVEHLWAALHTREMALVLGAWLAGALVVLAGRAVLRGRWVPLVPLAAGTPFLLDVLLARVWATHVDYRLATVLAVVPLLGMMAVDLAGREREPAAGWSGPQIAETWVYARTGLVALLVFCALVTVQGMRWTGDVSRMRAVVAGVPPGCVADPAAGTVPNALDNWSWRSLAVVVQGRAPRVVFGSAGECAALRERRVYSASSFFPDRYRADLGWFTLPR